MIEINKKSDCCGCSACANICTKGAISFVNDCEGFKYPLVNRDACIKCGKCIKVCPIKFRDNNKVSHTPIKLFAAHSKDEQNWISSSSGGVFQILANSVIDSGGYVCGVIYDSDLSVIHYCTSDRKELTRFQGSKYVQSNLKSIYSTIRNKLKSDSLVLFSGTPCQVEGLNCFLGKKYDNLLTCDLICHCVPSPLIFKDYLSYIQKKYNKKITGINMKDKSNGWGHQSPRIFFEDGSNIFGVNDSVLWNDLFYSQLITRPSCHECRFTNVNRPGDITIGDFWGIEKSNLNFYDKRGISLILVNTVKGYDLIKKVSPELSMIEANLEQCIQPNLKHPVEVNPKRELFWKDYQYKSFEGLVYKYFYKNRSILGKVYRKLFGD